MPTQPSDLNLLVSDWRSGQWEAIEKSLNSRKRFVGQCMPTGWGKSIAIIAEAQHTGKRTLILTSSKSLQQQYLKEFRNLNILDIRGKANYSCRATEVGGEYYNGSPAKSVAEGPCQFGEECSLRNNGCTYYDKVRDVQRARLVNTNYAAWISANLYTEGWGKFDLVACDEAHECFVAGTTVGNSPIESVSVGTLVESFDSNRGTFEWNRVIRVHKRKPKSLVRVTTSSGRELVCTPEHPFWTPIGWKVALDLVGNFVYNTTYEIHEVQKLPYQRGFGFSDSQNAASSQKAGKGLLLSSLWQGRAEGRSLWPGESTTRQKVALGANETKQPHERSGDPSKDVYNTAGNTAHATNTRGKWAATACATADVSTGSWMGYRSSSAHWTKQFRQGLPDGVQTGRGQQRTDGWDRSRRIKPPISKKKETGREERDVSSWDRVDCVEILQQTSDGRFGGLCPDGHVYNLEVENDHTYIANGIIVHNCEDWLARLLAVKLPRCYTNLVKSPYPESTNVAIWTSWAARVLPEIRSQIRTEKKSIVESRKKRIVKLRTLQSVESSLIRMSSMTYEWKVFLDDCYVLFQPIWIHEYAEPLLFGGADKVIFASSTIVPNTLNLLGIPDNSMDFHSYPSTFPVERRSIYYYPVVRMRHEMTEEENVQWVNVIDDFISKRLDRKGIIHTVSYARQETVMRLSRYRNLMVVGLRSSASQGAISPQSISLQKFRVAKAPSILVGPTWSVGIDLPGKQCEYTIIPKVPFGDITDPLNHARSSDNPDYGLYRAGMTLTQSIGRAMRSEQDQNETLITDSAFGSFVTKHRRYIPSWIWDAVKTVGSLPEPLERL